MTIPWYLWPLVLIPVVAMTITSAFTAFERKGTAALGFAGLWLTWTALAGWLAVDDVFRQDPQVTNPALPLTVVGGATLLVLLSRVPAVAARTVPEPAAKLVAPHAYRLAGAVFVIAMMLGLLPPVFALTAGLGDMAVGAAALIIIASHRRPNRKTLLWFNILGLLDLVAALGIGALAGLGPTQLIHSSPSTEAVTMAPLVFIPVVAVPLLAALHIVSLKSRS